MFPWKAVAIRPRGLSSPHGVSRFLGDILKLSVGMAKEEKLQGLRPGTWQIGAICRDGPLTPGDPCADAPHLAVDTPGRGAAVE